VTVIMSGKLKSMEERYDELNRLRADPDIIADYTQWQNLSREQSSLEATISPYKDYKKTLAELEDTRSILSNEQDPEMASLVQQEIETLQAQCDSLLQQIKLALFPKDPHADKNVIMEIRAGTGGDEASIFAGDLFRMYSRYAQSHGWEVDVIDNSEGTRGGFKEVILEINGKGVFGKLKHESGGHRVQRVPATETNGRTHTSTATVAVFPEAKEVDVQIDTKDLRVDIFHSGGPGGQNVNKVATAVRITHSPSGLVVVCQDERSQLRNRTKAMAILRAKLLDLEQSKQQEEITQDRRSQVGTGERAEKIRTYNFPQDRLTDHRIGMNFHNLPAIMDGYIDSLLEAVSAHAQSEENLGDYQASPL